MTPDTVMAVTFSIDHLEVRTKILTRIAIGIKVRINVGKPKIECRKSLIDFKDFNNSYSLTLWGINDI